LCFWDGEADSPCEGGKEWRLLRFFEYFGRSLEMMEFVEIINKSGERMKGDVVLLAEERFDSAYLRR
jgi:hypothetical protein